LIAKGVTHINTQPGDIKHVFGQFPCNQEQIGKPMCNYVFKLK